MKIEKVRAFPRNARPFSRHVPYGYDIEDEIRPYSRYAYVVLSCLHYTTPDDIERLSLWQPKRGLYWCEQCAKWQKKRSREKTEYPQEPMF